MIYAPTRRPFGTRGEERATFAMSALSAFPPAPQEMVAGPLVDAAVRQCDDVLSSDTVTLRMDLTQEFDVVKGGFWQGYDWQSKSGRFPITSGDDKNAPPALFVIITVPRYDEFVINITTADGRLVARTSPYAPNGVQGAPFFPPAKPGAWVEWGGAHHGHIDRDFTKKMALAPCCPISTKNSVGPTEAVSVRDDTLSPRYVCLCMGASLLCFGIPLVFVSLLCCHEATEVRNRNTGERLGKQSYPGGCFASAGIKVPLQGMNREQRRLTLLAFIFDHAERFSAKPQHNNGGGGGGGGGG